MARSILCTLLLGLLLMATMAPPVKAQRSMTDNIYIFGGAGLSELSMKNPDLFEGDAATSRFTFAAGLGYQFSQYFGTEVAFQHFGERDFDGTFLWEGDWYDDEGTISSYAIRATLVGTYPLQRGFSLKARVGPNYWNVQEDEVFAGVPESHDASGVSVDFGLGAGFMVTPNIEVAAIWDFYLGIGDENETGDGNANTFCLGIGYMLGRR